VITLLEVAQATGIHRATLSKIANERGYVTSSEYLERLCRYFGCSFDQLMELAPEDPKRKTGKKEKGRAR